MDVIHLCYDAYRLLRHNVATYVLCMFAVFYTTLQPALYSGRLLGKPFRKYTDTGTALRQNTVEFRQSN